jgi:hypothetical protein
MTSVDEQETCKQRAGPALYDALAAILELDSIEDAHDVAKRAIWSARAKSDDEPRMSDYCDRWGPIPEHNFENDPFPAPPMSEFMTPEQIAAYHAEFERKRIERMRRMVEEARERRRKTEPNDRT